MENIKLYTDLLGIITNQTELIVNQNNMIASLVNENAEKENMINVLMSENN